MNATFINTANIAIDALIKSEILQAKRKKIAQNLAKNAKIDGFRKGKVPLSVIEGRFSEQITRESHNDALGELIRDALKSLSVEEKRVIGNPSITTFDISDEGLKIEAKIGIFPQIALENYENLIPKVEIPSVSESEIDARIAQIALRSGEVVESDKEATENGDIANIDFEGFLGENAFEGGKGEHYDLEIGSKSFIAGFEEQIIGMKKGEEKDIKVTFPPDYNATHLAGKEARFKVKLNAIKHRIPSEINDDFARKMLPNDEGASVESLRNFTKKQLENEAKSKIFSDLKPTLADNLIGGISFDLPENIVESEMDIIFRNALSQMDSTALKKLQNDANEAKSQREKHRSDAEKSVKLTFIVDSLAKKERIGVSDNEVQQMIYYESLMTGANPREMLTNYQNNNLIPALRMSILENKVLDFLLESALNAKNTGDSAKDFGDSKDSAKNGDVD